ANPAAADCLAISARMRQRKAELLRAREQVAAAARVHYSVGRADAAREATDRIRAFDRELGELEDSLDRVHDLLRPGSDRKKDQRTRGAALAIAAERLESVKAELVRRGIPASRIEIRRPRYEATGEVGAVRLVPHRRA